MSVREIQDAITGLSVNELAELAAWFERYHGEIWDRELEADIEAGYMDDLIREAEADYAAGRYREIPSSLGSHAEYDRLIQRRRRA